MFFRDYLLYNLYGFSSLVVMATNISHGLNEFFNNLLTKVEYNFAKIFLG